MRAASCGRSQHTRIAPERNEEGIAARRRDLSDKVEGNNPTDSSVSLDVMPIGIVLSREVIGTVRVPLSLNTIAGQNF